MIFISHATPNDEMADIVVNILESNGMKCWVDHREENLYHGADWAGEIKRSIERSDLLILLLTKESNASYQCPKEINIADGKRIPILTLYVDNIAMNDSFEYHLSLFHHLFCFDGVENHADSIVNSARRLIEERKKGNEFIANANKESLRRYSQNYAIKNQSVEKLFNESEIDDGLIPHLHCEDKKRSFEGMLSVIEKHNVAITAPDGGAGKTTFLLKLFHHYISSDSMIPIYIEMKALTAKKWVFERYIDMILAEKETAMDMESTDQFIQDLCDEFSEDTDKPEYLLLLDGFNEVPPDNRRAVISQLKCLLERKNVRVVITSRKFDEEIIQSTNLVQYKMDKLSVEKVNQYLDDNNLLYEKNSKNKELVDILSLPMFLDIYISSGGGKNIRTKGELLHNFISWQEKKNELAEENETKNRFILNFVLPAVAFYMVAGKAGSYEISRDECYKILNDILSEKSEFLGENALFSDIYTTYFDDNDYDLRKIESLVPKSKLSEKTRNKDIISFFTSTCGLMKQSTPNNFKFIHQNYRDFLCAYFISREMQMSQQYDDFVPDTLSKALLEEDVVAFISDLLGEYKLTPFCDNDKQEWNYDCNDKSVSYKCLDFFRGRDASTATGNLVNILKYARKTELSNCDFSQLDLTQCFLNNCVFYRFYNDKKYSTSFEGSKLNRENLIAEAYYGELEDACLMGDILATCDETSRIRLWDIKSKRPIPIKSFQVALCPIRKILFLGSGCIIAMTDYDIASIDLESYEVETLFTSKDLLNEIFIDDNGEISYTTIINPLNKKSLENSSEHRIKFSPFTTISAINKSESLIAFRDEGMEGHLSIYSPEKGYMLLGSIGRLYNILMAYTGKGTVKIRIKELKKAFDSEFYKNEKNILNMILEHIDFLNANSDVHSKVVSANLSGVIIAPYRVGKVTSNSNDGSDVQSDFMISIIDCFANYSGINKIHPDSLEFIDASTLLISDNGSIYIYKVGSYELTKIFSVKSKRIKSIGYYDGKIVIVYNRTVVVLDEKYNEIFRIKQASLKLSHMVKSDELIFVSYGSTIYGFDSELKCQKSLKIPYGFTEPAIAYSCDDNKPYFFCSRKPIDINSAYIKPEITDVDNFYNHKWLDIRIPGRISFKRNNNVLVAIDSQANRVCAKNTLQMGLVIVGCNFKGIRGSLADSSGLSLLEQYGGII